MNPRCQHIVLEDAGTRPGAGASLYLVDASDALWLCRDGAYERVGVWEAQWRLAGAAALAWDIERLGGSSGLVGLQGPRGDAAEVLARLKRALARGELVALRPGQVRPADEPLRAQRQLLRTLEARTRGQLTEQVGQYRLVAGADLAGLLERDRYEVVPHEQAKSLLVTLAAQPGLAAGAALLLGKASGLLSADWRPPCNRKVRVVVPEGADAEVVSDEEGKISVGAPEGCEFDLVIANLHEGGAGDSLETPSGIHFAAGRDGPEAAEVAGTR